MQNINVLHIYGLNGFGGVAHRLIDLFSKPVSGFKFFIFSEKPIYPLWEEKLKELNVPFQCGTNKKHLEKELAEFASKQNITIAHFHTPWREGQKALKRVGIKIIIEHDHCVSWQRSLWNNFRDRLFNQGIRKQIDGIIGISNATRTVLINRMWYKPQKIRVIYNGINFDNLTVTSPVPRPKEKKIIITISRLVTLKGIESLLRAVPIVLARRKDVEFWIIGDGPLNQYLQDLSSQLRITSHVTFWGRQHNVANFLVSSDLFVLPSIREPLGNVLIEAGYFKKPSIATNIDGICEIIVDNETGKLIEPTIPIKSKSIRKDRMPKIVVNGRTKELCKPKALAPNDLANSILDLLNQPELVKTMGEKAHQRVVQLFSIERYRDQIIDFYKSILKAKGIQF